MSAFYCWKYPTDSTIKSTIFDIKIIRKCLEYRYVYLYVNTFIFCC